MTFAPVREWTGGAGLAVRARPRPAWSVGVSCERDVFGLRTAHRDGSAMILAREGFGDWSVRLEVGRVFARGPEGSE